MTEVLAIIPARGGSKRVPRKNLKEISGIPLVGHAVLQAQDSKYINKVLVSTDDSEIEKVAISYGASVISRPEEYRHDNTLMEAEDQRVDIVVLLYPTAPLRTSGIIDQAIERVLLDDNDSCLSLIEDQGYFWRESKDSNDLSPYNYDPKNRMPSVMHPYKQFKENKAVYVCKKDLLLNTGCRLGGKIGYVTMSALDSVDIDTEDDLRLCEELFKLRS